MTPVHDTLRGFSCRVGILAALNGALVLVASVVLLAEIEHRQAHAQVKRGSNR